MKKILLLILCCLFILTISGCEDNYDGKLIELTGVELTNAVSTKDNALVFALYDSRSKDGEQFLSDLEKCAKETHEDIYYVDVNFLDFSSSVYLSEIVGSFDNSYSIYDGNDLSLTKKYTFYTSMYLDLKDNKYTPEIEYTTKEEEEEYLNFAKEYYEKGEISKSLSFLYLMWNKKEAKEYYNANDNYKLIHYWETYVQDGENVEYYGLEFGFFFNTLSFYYKKDKLDGFVKPTEYDFYYYYIKDNDVYVSEQENGKYKKLLSIDSVDTQNTFFKINGKVIGTYIVY